MTTVNVPQPTEDVDVGMQFYGMFRSPSLENAFRRYYLADDIALVGGCLVVVVVGGLLYSLIDYRLFSFDWQFHVLLEIRLLSYLVALLSWQTLRRCTIPASFDRLVLLLCVFAALMSLYVGTTRPPGRVGHAVVTVMLVAVTYSVVPLPLRWQTLLASLFSTAYVVLMPDHGITQEQAATTGNIAAAFALANVLGIATSWRLNRRRRVGFVVLMREAALRRQLQEALAEVQALRGATSMCGRDDLER